jgi:hypothetical protein
MSKKKLRLVLMNLDYSPKNICIIFFIPRKVQIFEIGKIPETNG